MVLHRFSSEVQRMLWITTGMAPPFKEEKEKKGKREKGDMPKQPSNNLDKHAIIT
jgi:hypothetical protein